MNRFFVNACVGLALFGCHLVSHAERYALVPDQVIDGVQETARVDIAVLVEDARIVDWWPKATFLPTMSTLTCRG